MNQNNQLRDHKHDQKYKIWGEKRLSIYDEMIYNIKLFTYMSFCYISFIFKD